MQVHDMWNMFSGHVSVICTICFLVYTQVSIWIQLEKQHHSGLSTPLHGIIMDTSRKITTTAPLTWTLYFRTCVATNGNTGKIANTLDKKE